MKLQILVPHYKETYGEIEPLLDSIAIQQSVDFSEVGVVIAYDGPDAEELCREPNYNTEVSADMGRVDLPVWQYPFKIEHVRLPEHVGVSATRNAALDAATADYVMFCDADDMLCHACGLHIVFSEIDNGGFDTLVSTFIEETRHPETKKPLYVNHDMDSTFVHGKVHRRGYLVDEGIRFDPSLTVHEDSYFNILAQNCADPQRAKFCPHPFYLWKWRDSSVCRHDPDYILKTYNNMLDSNDALVAEFERRGMHDKARTFCCVMIMDAYYTMNKREWLDKTHADYRDAVERRFARYFADHRAMWDEANDVEKMGISNGIRTRSVMEGMPMESMTIDAWLGHISEIR